MTHSELPLILAGPILQHTTANDVTVWLALQKACTVSLTVYGTTDGGEAIASSLMTGERGTIKIGEHLHIVAVTAWATIPLESAQIYAYDLTFTVVNQETSPQNLRTAIASSLITDVSLSYFQHQLPTFVLPPEDINNLRLIHGSCRKPHGKGHDGLAILDRLIGLEFNHPQSRPHQLFLTGDQIYGDDVADPFLWLVMEWSNLLLGWTEDIPLPPPGQRSHTATVLGGFTAGLDGKVEKSKSHLFSLGEYCVAYLLAWSDILWLKSIPQGKTIYPQSPKLAKHWDEELQELANFAHTLPKIRRSLANIPMYSIFDDHDISDDWYLNLHWCNRVLSKPLGRRVVQNGLIAYSLFQGWGNTPKQFLEGEKGAKLLSIIEQWSENHSTDTHLEVLLQRYLGIPEIDSHTNLPKITRDGDVWVLDRHEQGIPWYYALDFPNYQIIVLDTRTWRGYPVNGPDISPPMLLSPQAFKLQLQDILNQDSKETDKITLVIAPTNLFGLKAIDWIQNFYLRRQQVFSYDVGDSWNMHNEALAQLLTTLFNQRYRLIILSGDIHYAGVVKLNFWSKIENGWQSHVLAQLTASAIKNTETITQIIHTKFKSMIFPESDRWWVGWIIPPNLVEINPTQINRYSSTEWVAQLQWIQREPLQIASNNLNGSWFKLPRSPQSPILRFWNKLINLIKTNKLYLWWQEGKEVVGKNNIALVHFRINNSDDSTVVVIQDVYWYWPDRFPHVVYSRFTLPLNTDNHPMKFNQ